MSSELYYDYPVTLRMHFKDSLHKLTNIHWHLNSVKKKKIKPIRLESNVNIYTK